MIEFANLAVLHLDVIAGGTPGFVQFGGRHLRFLFLAARQYNTRPKKKVPAKKDQTN